MTFKDAVTPPFSRGKREHKFLAKMLKSEKDKIKLYTKSLRKITFNELLIRATLILVVVFALSFCIFGVYLSLNGLFSKDVHLGMIGIIGDSSRIILCTISAILCAVTAFKLFKKAKIDWKEHQIFVKDYFPVDVHTNEATFDIQYGNVKRPTHANTSWDFAKFEVCHHKWMDVSEEGYGVSFLNDCKFGVGVHGSEVGLSMLKSAIYPNPDADKEHHEFTYSIYPHAENWTDANTVAQAYELNNPMTAVVKENEGGKLAGEYSLFKVDQNNVIIETVKKAENGEDLIVRMYECYNRRTNVVLTCGEKIADVTECNLLEEEEQPVSCTEHTVSFAIKPYEIKTLKIRRK